MHPVEDETTLGKHTGSRNSRGTYPGTDLGRSGWVTTAVAAAALGISPRRVRTLIKNGELEAVADGEGVNKVYSVSIASLETLRDRRASAAGGRGSSGDVYRKSSSAEHQGGNSTEHMADVIRELAGRLETRAASEAELRTRLELTAKAESTLREDLARERERADRLEAELQEARKPLPEPRDASETASEGAGKVDASKDSQEPVQRRSWLYRFFFGPG